MKKAIHIQHQKIGLLKSRLAMEQKELQRLQHLHIESEKAKLLRKWYPKIKDDFFRYHPDLINAILTLVSPELGNAKIEIRNINYDVKFYYYSEGEMKCIS